MNDSVSVRSCNIKAVSGIVNVPGDKSISHRSLMLSAISIGKAKISGLLEGEDVISTASALKALGVTIEKKGDIWEVDGVGVKGLSESDSVLNMGNSGTSVRLMMGLVSPYNFNTVFTGDASLCKRPMGRVIAPLEKMGVRFLSRNNSILPITVVGTDEVVPITYELPVASAQVKSAVLLAGLNTPGVTTVIESETTRDHTELMLRSLGAKIDIEEKEGKRHISVAGGPNLKSIDINVPADPSSAAFLIVAALITPESEITVKNVCINEHRIGLYTTLKEMDADLEFSNERIEAGEKIADITARSSKLKAVVVPAKRAPSMIDEYPILAVAASCANGKTVMEGLAELKVKESNRLQAIADGLQVNGVKHEVGEDSLIVYGGEVQGGGLVTTHMDHRIAMSFLILGMVSKEAVCVDDSVMINTSFPGFIDLVNGVGGRLLCA